MNITIEDLLKDQKVISNRIISLEEKKKEICQEIELLETIANSIDTLRYGLVKLEKEADK